MKILLDTQVFLWWISDNPNISSKFHDIMAEPANEIYFSAASGWEIAIREKTPIIAQSQIENIPIATTDGQFKNYEVDLIW